MHQFSKFLSIHDYFKIKRLKKTQEHGYRGTEKRVQVLMPDKTGSNRVLTFISWITFPSYCTPPATFTCKVGMIKDHGLKHLAWCLSHGSQKTMEFIIIITKNILAFGRHNCALQMQQISALLQAATGLSLCTHEEAFFSCCHGVRHLTM